MTSSDFGIDPARLEENWRSISADLDAPRPRLLERSLRALRLPNHVTRLIVATPALRRSWWIAIAVVALVGLGTTDGADPRESLIVFLIAAPLVPLIGVALAFGPASDPSHELMLATPMTGLRVLVVRTLTVLLTSLVVITPLALVSDVGRSMAFAWILPALAVTAATAAGFTALAPRRSALIVAVVWIVVVLAARAAASDPLVAFGPIGQPLAIVVTVAACAVTVRRRAHLDRLEVAT